MAHHPVGRFEAVYRETAPAITAYFLRRTADPQTAADLTADTFVEAMSSFSTYSASKGRPRPWVFAIARRVHARHWETRARDRHVLDCLGGHRELDTDELDDLLDRIDAEGPGMALLQALSARPAAEREVLELVALAGFSPTEAAQALGITSVAARVRLFRARRALREHAGPRTELGGGAP